MISSLTDKPTIVYSKSSQQFRVSLSKKTTLASHFCAGQSMHLLRIPTLTTENVNKDPLLFNGHS